MFGRICCRLVCIVFIFPSISCLKSVAHGREGRRTKNRLTIDSAILPDLSTLYFEITELALKKPVAFARFRCGKSQRYRASGLAGRSFNDASRFSKQDRNTCSAGFLPFRRLGRGSVVSARTMRPCSRLRLAARQSASLRSKVRRNHGKKRAGIGAKPVGNCLDAGHRS